MPRPTKPRAARRAIADMVEFCLDTSREEVRAHDGDTVSVVTALAPLPHPRFSNFFAQIKQDLGFGIYVPDCDTTACSFSAATQAGSTDPILDQPLLDFYAGYQVGEGANEPQVTVPLNDNIDYDGGIVTWIDNLAGERPYGNDLDPDAQPRHPRSQFPQSARAGRSGDAGAARDRAAHHRLPAAAGGERRLRQSALAYLLSAGTLLRLFRPLLRRLHARCRRPRKPRSIPTTRSTSSAASVLAYVQDELIAHEMNAFDAALALIALGHLGADPATLRAGAALHRRQRRRGRPAWAVQGL